MADDQSRTVADIRAERNALQGEEDAISFVRRLAQGRLDLVRDEQRRRASGAEPGSASLTDRLADVFGQQHGGGSARPPRETNVAADHPLVLELDELSAHFQFEQLENLDDKSLDELGDALALFEKTCSQKRHDMFERIDALTAELVQRVREGGAGSVVKDK